MFDHCFVIVEISIPIVKTAVFKYFTQKSSPHSVHLLGGGGYLAEFHLYSTVIPLTPLDLLDLLYYLFSTEDALILTIHPRIALPLTFFFFNFFA